MTKIEWVVNPDGSQGRTWNPITGCTKISPGCLNCYAERMSKRLAGRCGYPADEPFRVTYHQNRLEEPLRWRKPQTVFVCSMADLFHEAVPDMAIIEIFAIMAQSGHTFLVLTKRPKRMQELLSCATTPNDVWVLTPGGLDWNKPVWPLPNVWLGVTAENQEQADKRIPLLLQTPAAVRFVSVEPMLGPVDLTYLNPDKQTLYNALEGVGVTERDAVRQSPNVWGNKLDWVIVGGETGPGARPMHPDWVRSLARQCHAAQVPFFFKSWGDYLPQDQDPEFFTRPETTTCRLAGDGSSREISTWSKVGKKKAGALLDGREWREMPCLDA